MEETETYVPHPDHDIIEAVPQKRHEDYIVEDAPARKSIVLLRTYQMVWFLLGVIETLLIFRFVLKMIGASTISGFTDFIYAVSSPFAAPFIGTLPASVSGSSVLEWSTLIGIIVYIVLAYGAIEIIRLLTPVSSTSGPYVTRKTRYAI